MACDGRATVYDTIVDENAKKIHKVKGCLIGFAGRYSSGLEFVEWFSQYQDTLGVQEELPHLKVELPEVLEDEEFSALVAYPDGTLYLFEDCAHSYVIDQEYYAIGSGFAFALAALDAGLSAEEAVKVAVKRDIYSGGTIYTEEIGYDAQETLTLESAEGMTKEELLVRLFVTKQED